MFLVSLICLDVLWRRLRRFIGVELVGLMLRAIDITTLEIWKEPSLLVTSKCFHHQNQGIMLMKPKPRLCLFFFGCLFLFFPLLFNVFICLTDFLFDLMHFWFSYSKFHCLFFNGTRGNEPMASVACTTFFLTWIFLQSAMLFG